MKQSKTLEETLLMLQLEEKVCPLPDTWNKLWDMLPGKIRIGNGWNPPLPLILAAWHATNDDDKFSRFKDHMQYGYETGIGEEISDFVHSIPKSQWHFKS